MVAVAGLTLWLGGWVFAALVAVVGAIALYEWVMLALKLAALPVVQVAIVVAGVVYIGFACYLLITLRNFGLEAALLPIAATVATDVGAYFTGRTIGGPKIAPSISPSKTWSGLIGGMIAAGLAVGAVATMGFDAEKWSMATILLGAILAIVAQVGDFAESSMKRRAGVKDSGTLIPGHGGVLDRIDGLLAVVTAFAIISLISALWIKW